VQLGQWDQHRLISLEGTTWSTGFTPELQAEAERLLAAADQPQPGDDARVDLCALHTVTIDDDDTRDIDDALSLERLADGRRRLWIHVADPGRLIAPDSPLDLEARRRGSSLYLAGGILPMFPELLSTGVFSLRAGQRCAAWSTWVDLDADGAIQACGVERSWVQPTYRLSYADADDLIERYSYRFSRLSTVYTNLARFVSSETPRGQQPLGKDEFRCFGCGGVIRREDADCGLCGWTWK